MADPVAPPTETLYAEPEGITPDRADEESRARRLAQRYQLEFVDHYISPGGPSATRRKS